MECFLLSIIENSFVHSKLLVWRGSCKNRFDSRGEFLNSFAQSFFGVRVALI